MNKREFEALAKYKGSPLLRNLNNVTRKYTALRRKHMNDGNGNDNFWATMMPPAGFAVRSQSSSAPPSRGSWLRRFLRWIRVAG